MKRKAKSFFRKKYYLVAASVCLVGILLMGYYFFFTGFSCQQQTCYVYVDMDDKGNGTLKRSKKKSYGWMKHIIETNGAALDE